MSWFKRKSKKSALFTDIDARIKTAEQWDKTRRKIEIEVKNKLELHERFPNLFYFHVFINLDDIFSFFMIFHTESEKSKFLTGEDRDFFEESFVRDVLDISDRVEPIHPSFSYDSKTNIDLLYSGSLRKRLNDLHFK